MKNFLTSMKESITLAPVWLFMAHQDVVAKYRRTALGPWWITLGTGLGLSGMGIIWAALFNVSLPEVFPYLTIGFVIWTFIATTLVEGANVFVTAGATLKTIHLPLLVIVFFNLLKNLYTLLHTFVLCLIVLIAFQVKISVITLLFIPGLVLLIVTAFFVNVILGILGARFRDLSYIISAFMTFIFLLTPVMWDPKILEGKKVYLAHFNPITHYLVVIRDPLLNKIPPMNYYYSVFIIIIGLAIIANFLYNRFSKRIIFWL